MASGQVSPKVGKVIDIPANAPTIGTATDLVTDGQVSVAFTAGSTTTGGPVFSYTAKSNPGSLTGTSTTSPITVSGLTNGTAYTFTVAGVNATGTGPYSSASNSATPTINPASFESIATFTPTSGTQVSFTSIPSTYQHLQIRYNVLLTTSAQQITLQVNGDTGSNYARNYFVSTAASGRFSGYGTGSSNIIAAGVYDGTAAPDYPNVGIIDIYNYAKTNQKKSIRSFAGSNENSATRGNMELCSGVWLNTAAITSIQINSGTYAAGTSFALYGIKG